MSGPRLSFAHLPLGGVPFAAPRDGIDTDPLENVGRRAAPRLRLSIPARLITVSETRRCVLIDVSRSGAQISLARPMAQGDAGFLLFAGLEVFGCAVRASEGYNGIEFDHEMNDGDVLAIRRYAENHDAHERRALMEEARVWVTGGGKSAGRNSGGNAPA